MFWCSTASGVDADDHAVWLGLEAELSGSAHAQFSGSPELNE